MLYNILNCMIVVSLKQCKTTYYAIALLGGYIHKALG